MSPDPIDLARLNERLVTVRRAYGENIDLPNLEPNLFALLLGRRLTPTNRTNAAKAGRPSNSWSRCATRPA